MPTIKDVAAAAGVSVATVSRVVNNGPKVGETLRERVRKVMDELGYRPNANARALVTQKNHTIGVVLGEITDPFFASLAGGIDQVARKQDLQMLLSSGYVGEATERKAIDTLLEQRCEAIVVHAKSLSDELLTQYASQAPGLIFINRFIPAIPHRCVWLDNITGGQLAAHYLHSLGHRNFAVINSNYNIEDPKLRLEGIAQALTELGCQLPPSAIEVGAPNELGGEEAAQNLLAKGANMTAVMVYNDAMASGVMSVLADNGLRVPEDISVTGFDDVLLARYLRPKLTTLRYPIELMAMEAARMALMGAQDPLALQKNYPQGRKYTPTLVKRYSTSAPR